MLLPYSKALILILPPPKEADLDKQVELGAVCGLLVHSEAWPPTVRPEILTAHGYMSNQDIVLLLRSVAERDSAVRDVLTLGHLAKVLSRLDKCNPLTDLALFALPNKAFDEMSQRERSAFFSAGKTLPIALTDHQAAKARSIMETEHRMANAKDE